MEELELLKSFFAALRSPEIRHGRRLRLWERLGAHWSVNDAEDFLSMLHLFQALVEDALAKR